MKHINELERIFQKQKDNYSPSTSPSYETRMDRLDRLDKMIRTHFEEITLTLREDFGSRSLDHSFTGDIYPVLSGISKAKKGLKQWMKKERATTLGMALTGQREYIINEPLGVIGVMSPFNAPVSLALDPTVEALAAGNTVIIKLSESTPKTATLLTKLIKKYFDESELASIEGDIEVSKKFASMPWDLFFFTGGSEVGKRILSATAENLTPSILELGGKSPCVILDNADIEVAAKKIGRTRVMNAGQVCISGDYVLIPKRHLEDFISHAVKAVEEKFPTIINNEDYTSIINDVNYHRIIGYIDEAKSNGTRIVQANASNEKLPDRKTRKIPLTIAVNPSMELQVAKYEIFGPILTIFTYDNLDEAIKIINDKEKPLALYIFGKNKKDINKIVTSTSSGGVTINDLLMHADASHMGFGGVGYSGMGRYKGGIIGYRAFTNPKGVVESGLMRRFSDMFQAPYNDRTRKIMRRMAGIRD